MISLEVFAPPAGNPTGPLELHRYEAVDLLDQSPAFMSEYEHGRFEQPNVQVEIPVAYLGVPHYLDVPEGDWRARVLFFGTVLLNGRVRRADVEFDSGAGKFVVTVVDDATDEARARLRDVRLTDLPADVHQRLDAKAEAITVLRREEYRPDITRSRKALSLLQRVHGVRTYRLLNVVQAAFEAAGLTGHPTTVPAFRYAYEQGAAHLVEEDASDAFRIFSMQGYNGPTLPYQEERVRGGTPEATIPASSYSRTSITLPTWDGWKLTECLLKLNGQTLRARYEAFPGEAIEADLISDRWQPDMSAPELAGILDAAGYTMHRQDAKFPALSVEMDRHAYQPEIITWGGGWKHVSGDPAEIDLVYNPPPYAATAPARWLFDAEGKPLDGDTVKVDLTLANCGTYGGDGWLSVNRSKSEGGRSFTMRETWGYPVVDGMSDERCYVYAHRAEDQGGRLERALLYYQLDRPAPGQLPAINPTWARGAFRQYELSRSRRDTVEGTALTGAALSITELDPGTPAGGFLLEGRPWLTEMVERRTKLALLSFRGVRPVDNPDTEPDQPYYTGPVSDLVGEFVDVENGISPEREYVMLMWGWPQGSGARASSFDVERYHFGRRQWYGLAYRVRGQRVYSFDRWSQKDDNGDRYTLYRVRAVMEESDPAAQTVPDTLGPWSQVSIYF